MAKIEVKNSIVKSLDTVSINDKMSVFLLEITTNKNGVESKVQKEGVGDTLVVQAWDGINEDIHNGFRYFDKSALEKYKKYGYVAPHFSKEKWDYSDVNAAIDQNPYTSYINKNIEDRILMKLSSWDHSLTLENGTEVSRPYYFDYIDAHITDAHYDLEALAEIIHKRKDIVFLTKSSVMQGPLTDEQCKEIILEVPHYNRDCDKEFLNFLWALPQDKFDKMKQELPEKHTHGDIFRYIKKHDLLGIEITDITPKVQEIIVTPKNKFRK